MGTPYIRQICPRALSSRRICAYSSLGPVSGWRFPRLGHRLSFLQLQFERSLFLKFARRRRVYLGIAVSASLVHPFAKVAV